jgi:acyl-[acyl-carrier-protein]-phospholipid O-acyltransferase/long-chain-fatty-acid--[acyl-carrier-protein] ligase
LSRDRAFWGMTATQFLGAFNDNVFKQLVLLICAGYVATHQLESDPYQTLAQAMFAVPFVLFSGFAGWLSDRNSKRTIIVLCKIAEIVVMLAGVAVFLAGDAGSLTLIILLLAVLFLMGTQSAYFGPAKYGILPEMLDGEDLPAANGVIQMTTFLAIIFGTAAAGFAKQWFEEQLWAVSGLCVMIALIGTATSLLVRRTPVADPETPLSASSLAIDRETWNMLMADRTLRGVLLVSSLFWLLGGVTLPALNAFGKIQMGYPDDRTSLLAACVGIGIAAGCAIAGKLSRKRVNFHLATVGAWGMVATFSGMAFLPLLELPAEATEWTARLVLVAVGLFSGMFAVPLQVYLQARPPQDQKGRMIGAMNLVNWIGILMAAGVYFLCTAAFTPENISWTFLVLAAAMLPIAAFYRPRDERL